MEKVNVFVAYMVPDVHSRDIEKVVDEVKEVFQPEGKDESFFHATLLFIGLVNIECLPFIQKKMAETAREQKPISMNIDSLGYFYNQKKRCIKVLFARPKNISQNLSDLCMKLYKAIGEPLNDHAVPTIFPSRIHFTITKRLKNHLSKEDFDRKVCEIPSFSIPLTISGFGLYHCKDPGYRYYREIAYFDFAKG